MEYKQITSIEDPLFRQFFELMQKVFPKEEVLDFPLWEEPLKDPIIRMFVAVEKGEVVGATEYRYYPTFNITMTDFTLIGRDGKGVGPFLARERLSDIHRLADEFGKQPRGMFAEIYNPYEVEEATFGGVTSMNPFVRREVLSHLGYQKLNFSYVHPSWLNDGEAVSGLDFCFLPFDKKITTLKGEFIASFLKEYYGILSNKPALWEEMIAKLENTPEVELQPI